ncbi:hypothetical protein Hypma_009139 [Hypsizygus marmoreus]|uniref:DNA polymerase delta subunit 3 n=1 Tax=Hypsizygus marmoreus TaxID=39966 RepID=A0A369JUW6_HYPMA|nr:hypothetical protein Hypma_009139 [Hypsizygus marmoreus]
MSTQTVVDFLTKQIFIERNIVTYRSLSRDLRVHVNTAKNELAIYHDVAPYQSQTCAATYLLCGEPLPPKIENEPEDVDMDEGVATNEDAEYEDDGEEVPQTRIVLVNEKDLEDARSQFARLDSIHIYSLAPSPILDAGLICTPTSNIRAIDRGKDGAEVVRTVGKVVGANIKVQPAKAPHPPVAGPSRVRAPLNVATKTAAQRRPAVKEPVKEQPKLVKEELKPVAKLTDKPKATGKLDFSKAKPKDTKKSGAAVELKAESSASNSRSEVKNKKVKVNLDPQKRGTKRKSAVSMSDSEDDDTPSAAPSKPPSSHSSHSEKANVRVQKRTVLSDDDEDDPQPVRKPRMSRAKKAADSDTELNVKALMDIDDDQVIHITREAAIFLRKEEEESEEEDVATRDVDMVDDSVPKPKPKKRREKKVIPVGRNGLKKKRVIKSKQSIDAKGYTVLEDYSSYESVSEEEPESAAPAKGKTNAKVSNQKAKQEEDSSAPAPKLKPPAKGSSSTKNAKSNKSATTTKGAQKQNSLANFFMAKPKNN